MQKAIVITGALSGKIGYVEKSNKNGFVFFYLRNFPLKITLKTEEVYVFKTKS